MKWEKGKKEKKVSVEIEFAHNSNHIANTDLITVRIFFNIKIKKKYVISHSGVVVLSASVTYTSLQQMEARKNNHTKINISHSYTISYRNLLPFISFLPGSKHNTVFTLTLFFFSFSSCVFLFLVFPLETLCL